MKKLERYSYEKGKIEKNIARIAFNWPERANAQDYRSVTELNYILEEVRNDRTVDVVVLTGDGKWFSGGADLSGWEYELDGVRHNKLDVLDKDPEKYMSAERKEIENCLRILRLPQFVIGAINGACMGMTVDIALACDTRIASEKAFFNLSQVQLGLQALNCYALLPPLMGLSKAKRFTLKGLASYPNYTGANEARELGLVDEVLPVDKFQARVEEVARDVASLPRQTITLIKETFNIPVIAALEESSHRANLGQAWLRSTGFRESHKKARDMVKNSFKGAGKKTSA